MIKFLGHAGFEIIDNGFNFLLDPWLVNKAFLGSWLHFPPLDEDKINIEKIAKRCDALWISHEHPDHYDEGFVNLLSRDTKIVIPKFPSSSLTKPLEKLGFKNIVEVAHRHSYALTDTLSVEMVLEMPAYSVHGSIFVKSDNFSFFHNSDSTIEHEDLKYLNGKYSGCDLYAGQYSISSPFPDISLEMEEDEKFSHISNHLEWALRRFSSSYQAIGARQGIACAGPAININLDKDILKKRLIDENSKGQNHGFNFTNSLDRLKNSTSNCKVFIPKYGEEIDAHQFEKNKSKCNASNLVQSKVKLIEEVDFKKIEYLKSIDKNKLFKANKVFFKKLFNNCGFLICDIELEFIVKFPDLNSGILISFPDGLNKEVPNDYLPKEECFFEYTVPSEYWYEFISGQICYDEIHYSKCFSTKHSSDGYKGALFNAFRASHDREIIKAMQKDIIESSKETIKVSVDGVCKTFKARCPHLGIKLDVDNVNENKELICPGHGWRFSLNDGNCVFGDLTTSIKIEQDKK